MRYLNNLLRTAAGVSIIALAACGAERDATPASKVSPAYEETAPLPHQDNMPPEPQREGHPGPSDNRHLAPPADGRVPHLEQGLDPLDFEADLRPRERRDPVRVAVN
jgi:hypothetical protein